MFKQLILFVFLGLFVVNMAIATDYAPCGPVGAYVYVGDTQAKVLSTCGQPASARDYSASNDTTLHKVRWAYTQNYSINNNSGESVSINQGSRYVVEFVDEKVTQVYIGGMPYDSFDYCGPVPGMRRSIEKGDTMSQVRAMCGSPTFANAVDEKQTAEPSQLTEYIYQSDPSFPATTIVFENGIVKTLR